MSGRRRFLQTSLACLLFGQRDLLLAADKSLGMGVPPVVSAHTAFEIFGPLTAYLGKAFGQPVRLETPPDFRRLYQRTRENAFGLLLSPPHIARLAEKRLGWHPLVMCQPEHKSVLLAMEEHGPATLDDLRGGTLAVLDSSALVVMIMMEALAKKGLVMGRDFKVIETRSYESSQFAVRQGVAQAMIARNQGFIDPNARDRMKLLFEAGIVPGYVFIAAPATPGKKLQELRARLLAFGVTAEARPMLEKLGYDALVATSEEAMRRMDPYLDATEARLK